MQTHNFIIANGDTDSIAFKKPDEKPFTEEEQANLLAELNALMPKNIVWKNDKCYRRLIVCGAKNYIMDDGKTVKLKGSGLKGGKREPALREFIKEVAHLLVKDKKEQILFLYLQKVHEIYRVKNVTEWCFKVTVTKKVLEAATAFQKKQKEAIGNYPVNEGDKVHMFFKTDGSLCLMENFDGNFDRVRLLGKLRATIKVFQKVFDVELFPNFTLKRNQELLKSVMTESNSTAKMPPTGVPLTRK